MTENEKLTNIVNNMLVKKDAIKKVVAFTTVHNENGTADKSPRCSNCGPWKEHWHKISEEAIPRDGCCAVFGCTGLDSKGNKHPIEGCHVTIKNSSDDRVYIVPLCKGCNAKHGKDLILGKGMTLVWANVASTCGRLKPEK